MQRQSLKYEFYNYHRPSVFPRHSILAAKIASINIDAVWLPNFIQNVFRANFEQDLDIANPEIIAQCLTGLIANPMQELQRSMAQDQSILRRNTVKAIELGIFGAPSFRVGGELFWRNDRLEDALTYAQMVD